MSRRAAEVGAGDAPGHDPEEDPEGTEEVAEEARLWLDDEEYDDLVASEFGSDGRPKGDPPVVWIVVLLIVAVLGVALVVLA